MSVQAEGHLCSRQSTARPFIATLIFSPKNFLLFISSKVRAAVGHAELNRAPVGRQNPEPQTAQVPACQRSAAGELPRAVHMATGTLSGLERAGLVQEGETQRAQGTRGPGRSRGRSKNARAVLSHKCLKTGIRVPQALKLPLALNEPFVQLPRCRATEALTGLGGLHSYQFSSEFDKLL